MPSTVTKKPKSGENAPGPVKSRAASVPNSKSALHQYLEEIHRIPMLTREEEQEVARRARDGDQEARDLLVRSNLRFVVTVARRYKSPGLDLMDLISEGNTGLMRAAEKFNPERGFHFVSYAVWWIKQAIRYAIQQKADLIRLPLNRTADLRRIREANRMLENEDGIDTSPENIADIVDMRPEQVSHLMNISRSPASLDAPIGDGEDFSLVEQLEDESAQAPGRRLDHYELRREIDRSMEGLEDRERKIIKLRFGLDGGPVLSLKKIAGMIGLSKERVRQIENTAKRKLRGISPDLASFLT